MGLPSKPLAGLAVFLFFCGSLLADNRDETALLTLWQRCQKEPENHQALVQDAQAFEQSFPKSPLAGVARGLEAFHWLAAGKREEAVRVFQQMAEAAGDPVSIAGREMALRWLTRFDREAVKAGLLKVYADAIEYPDTLAPLGNFPESARPPLVDRWGGPWTYHPGAFQRINAGDKQTYVLESAKLGAKSDLAKSLAAPYGGGIALRAEKLLASQGGRAVLSLVIAQGKGESRAILTEGSSAGDLSFPYFGEGIVILSNGDYWFVEAKPGG